MRHIKICISVEFYILAALLLLFVPLQWCLSWFAAVFVHELSHYVALKAFRIDVFSINVGLSGAVMATGPLSCRAEVICALAGPAGGICLLLIGRWFPYVALFGALQAVYNLLPIYPLDGGRVLRCFAERFCYDRANLICQIIKWIVVLTLFLVVIFCFSTEPIFIIAVLTLLLKGSQ